MRLLSDLAVTTVELLVPNEYARLPSALSPEFPLYPQQAHHHIHIKMIQIETVEQFNQAVQQDKLMVVSFSAPWCGGCKVVAPSVAKLAEELKDTPFFKVSAEDLEEFCDEIEVDGFPSFRIYKNGEVLADYTGSKAEKVEEFIRKHVQ